MVITLKRIIVISDTHRSIGNCLDILDNIINIDIVIHLGDHTSDAEEISSIFPDVQMIKIRGNNDFDFSTPTELTLNVDGVKIFCCHGHMYSKKSLFKIAHDEGCQIILCGHTHISEIYTDSEITLLNPGSISRPRDYHCSYGVIEIEDGKFGLDIVKGVKL